MKNSAPTPGDPSALRAFLDRFHRLTTGDQLGAYAEIGRYLSAYEPKEVKADPELDVRERGLAAMRRVAGKLNAEPQRLTAAAYDRARIESEPSSQDIAKAWGGWKIARDTLVSGNGRETARQRAVRDASRGRYPHEGYVDGVRLWLDSDPPRSVEDAYDDWARVYNHTRPPDALPLACSDTIRSSLHLDWRELLRVARGDVEIGDARQWVVQPRSFVNRGARHDLIGRREVAALLGLSPPRTSNLLHKVGAPVAVIVIGRRRLWLRDDVLAYRDGRPVPHRDKNELRHDYLSTREVAAMTGRSVVWVRSEALTADPWLPLPRLSFGCMAIYDRAEVEASIAAHEVGRPRMDTGQNAQASG